MNIFPTLLFLLTDATQTLNTKERHEMLRVGFIPGNIDFWTDPHYRESFGIFVLDFLASKYGQWSDPIHEPRDQGQGR